MSAKRRPEFRRFPTASGEGASLAGPERLGRVGGFGVPDGFRPGDPA